jgi:ornithine cyclodeaminase/alanine dehydrogenase-like protein (mu-crystallin family)
MYISEEEVREHLTYDALIPAIRQALIDYSAGKVDQPPRTILRSNHSATENGWFALMPVVYGDVMAVKTVTFFPGNVRLDPKLGLHTHMAVIELLSRETGQPLAIMDGRLVTEMRTAAVSAVALDRLARPDVRSLGVLGAGVQARSHLHALRRLRPSLTDIRIWSRTPDHAELLANALRNKSNPGAPGPDSETSIETGTPGPSHLGTGEAAKAIRAVSIEEAASADVVLTVTASPTPVLQGRWLKPDALILAVGAVGAELRELDDEVAQSSWVVAESRQAIEREAGDVILSGAKVQAEIGQLLASPTEQIHTGPAAGGRILFKSVGMAIEDLVAARLVWQSHSRKHPAPA